MALINCLIRKLEIVKNVRGQGNDEVLWECPTLSGDSGIRCHVHRLLDSGSSGAALDQFSHEFVRQRALHRSMPDKGRCQGAEGSLHRSHCTASAFNDWIGHYSFYIHWT